MRFTWEWPRDKDDETLDKEKLSIISQNHCVSVYIAMVWSRFVKSGSRQVFDCVQGDTSGCVGVFAQPDVSPCTLKRRLDLGYMFADLGE